MGWSAFGRVPLCLHAWGDKRTECAANPSTTLAERRQEEEEVLQIKRRRTGKPGASKASAIDLAYDTNLDLCVQTSHIFNKFSNASIIF